MNLERQVLSFFELEVFAAELYSRHKRHVPPRFVALMEEFERVERQHIERFAALYQKISGAHRPSGFVPKWVARFMAMILIPFGWKTIFRFECWVEERAVMDYEAAMRWVKHPDVRKAIKETLKDEEQHAPYLETLQHFCDEERHHIEEMKNRLSKS